MKKYLEQKAQGRSPRKTSLPNSNLRYNSFASQNNHFKQMKKYFAVFKVNWQKSFEYRSEFIGHVGMGIISFAVLYFVWSAIFKSRNMFGNYTFSSMITYLAMTKFLHFTRRGNISRMIGDEIKEGKLSLYLLKPVSYLKWWFSVFLADRFFEFLVRLVLLGMFFLVLPKIIMMPKAFDLLRFMLFLSISLLVNYLNNLMIACVTFWITDVRLFRSTIQMMITFLAGELVPIDVMPPMIKKLSLLLPFQFTTFFPIKIYQGALSQTEIFRGLFLSLIWIFLIYFLLKWSWQKGLKRYEAVGQ